MCVRSVRRLVRVAIVLPVSFCVSEVVVYERVRLGG